MVDVAKAVEDIENPVIQTDEYGQECTENWKEYATYTTADFFAKLMQEFTKLELMPNLNGEVHFSREEVEGEEDKTLKGIYRECGWPSVGFRKEECMRRIREICDPLSESSEN